MGEWEERVCAVLSLEDAGVAEAPGAVETSGAVPVVCVGVGEAGFAKGAFLEAGGAGGV